LKKTFPVFVHTQALLVINIEIISVNKSALPVSGAMPFLVVVVIIMIVILIREWIAVVVKVAVESLVAAVNVVVSVLRAIL
jgi:hypothetical protein